MKIVAIMSLMVLLVSEGSMAAGEELVFKVQGFKSFGLKSAIGGYKLCFDKKCRDGAYIKCSILGDTLSYNTPGTRDTRIYGFDGVNCDDIVDVAKTEKLSARSPMIISIDPQTKKVRRATVGGDDIRRLVDDTSALVKAIERGGVQMASPGACP